VASHLEGHEARWLVEEASGLNFGEWEAPATARGASRLSSMLERRLAGEPLQYVLGRWGFRDLDLLVDRRVLIPRPETEVVAEVALAEARRILGGGGGLDTINITDLGTGSGALALTLANEVPEARVWATDVSPGVLDVASANLAGLGFPSTRVRLAQGVWFEALPAELQGHLHLIVSNPPYVSEAEFDALPPEVRDHEPRGALVAGPTGREALEHLVDHAPAWLVPGGAIVLELAPHQAGAMAERARGMPAYGQVEVQTDLAGRERVLVARAAGQ
jgi:release factor glutamine methyltransferase